jgi:hypothetical protein
MNGNTAAEAKKKKEQKDPQSDYAEWKIGKEIEVQMKKQGIDPKEVTWQISKRKVIENVDKLDISEENKKELKKRLEESL